MCGIAGGDHVDTLVDALQHRGGTSAIDDDGFPLGHVLHAVVGDVAQPLGRDTRLVANCEIYNWRKLAADYGIDAANDADLLHAVLEEQGTDILDELDGVYAFAWDRGDELVLARDVLGVKPAWYAAPGDDQGFAFASERQALEHAGYSQVRELHPRHVLRYAYGSDELTSTHRGFPWDATTDADGDERDIADAGFETAQIVLNAVDKRVPDEPVALLFSGGVDSTLIAAALQRLDVEFTAYTAGIQHGNVDPPRDVAWAEQVADTMGFEQVTVEASLDVVESAVPEIVDWISSTSPVKIGVALPFHVALQAADERVVMSGLGAEQLYAGYSRQHRDPNTEGIWGLRGLFHRDLYRDDVMTMRHGAELRLPFLDHDLVHHAMRIPGEHKVGDDTRKLVLRHAAKTLDVPEDVAWRKKRAAQYGSNFDKALARLVKDGNHDGKQAYLQQYRSTPEHRLAALCSGGKDSHAALYRMARRNNNVACLVNLQSRNDDSYMFDTKDRSLVERQAEALGLPVLVQETAGEKEEELADLEQALRRAAEEHGVDGVVAGALASAYQRDRVETVADRVGLKTFTPLWGRDPAGYMRWLVREGFTVQITETAARGLDASWAGTVLDQETVDELIDMAAEYRFNAAGEGGEYETVILDGPLFEARITASD